MQSGFSRVDLPGDPSQLDEVPQSVPARVTADSRYVLWVNGQEVGRGPARSQPARQRYDEYELAPFLEPGTNSVVVLVTFYGRATSFWQPAPAGGSPDAVLVFEANLGGGMLVSDESWRVHRSPAWTLPTRTAGIHGVPVEVLDSRQLPADWRETGFDDSAGPRQPSSRRPTSEDWRSRARRPIRSAGYVPVRSRTLWVIGSHLRASSNSPSCQRRSGQVTIPPCG